LWYKNDSKRLINFKKGEQGNGKNRRRGRRFEMIITLLLIGAAAGGVNAIVPVVSVLGTEISTEHNRRRAMKEMAETLGDSESAPTFIAAFEKDLAKQGKKLRDIPLEDILRMMKPLHELPPEVQIDVIESGILVLAQEEA